MSPVVLTRLEAMRLAVVAQHLHIADTDRPHPRSELRWLSWKRAYLT